MTRPDHTVQRPADHGLPKAVLRFVRSEDGNLFIVFLPLLFIMLAFGGMAVDFMRFETKRAMLQGVTDRATLAAANLAQTQDPKAVVVDYFTKAGMADQLSGDPVIDQTVGRRQVSVKSAVVMDTFFLRMLDGKLQTLSANATSTAVQGVGAVEVSLVLDLSGSMYNVVNGTTERRIDLLRPAAENFINDLTKPEFLNRISVSLVPYSEQVNVGPTIFNALNVNRTHAFSHCVELPGSAFTTTTFDSSTTLTQTQALQTNAFGYGGPSPQWTTGTGSTRDFYRADHDQPVCPRFTYERIIPISQDKTRLVNAIRLMQPRAGTSIFLGLKWGVALLDPSFRTVTAKLPTGTIDPAFVGRPLAYDPDKSIGESVRTLKYMVLMTDGFNDNSFRLQPEFYDDPSERFFWANHNFSWFINNGASPLGPNYFATDTAFGNFTTQFYTRDQGVGYMRSMCDAARNAGIVVYTISMSGDDTSPEAISGRTEMSACAYKPSYFFATSGSNLNQIFQQISRQITDLRLTQ